MTYVPLWKQWMQSDEYKNYKQNELPLVAARMSTLLDELNREAAERKRIKERDLEMAKEYQLRYVDKADGKVKESKHNSEKGAKDKARQLSYEHSPVQVGEVDGGKLLQQWNYDKGRQQAMDTKKQVTVAPISKKEASTMKSNTDLSKGETTMTAKKNGKLNGKKAAKAPAKKAAPAKEVKKTGTVRDMFELREGSNKEKLVDALLAAKGKVLTVSQLLKATYGSAKEDNKGALMMVMKGIPASIAKNKIKMELVKGKTDNKEMTFALKSK